MIIFRPGIVEITFMNGDEDDEIVDMLLRFDDDEVASRLVFRFRSSVLDLSDGRAGGGAAGGLPFRARRRACLTLPTPPTPPITSLLPPPPPSFFLIPYSSGFDEYDKFILFIS